jgi:hypothetical protein
MQQSKIIKNNSELEIIGTNSEQLVSSLTSVIEKFQLKRHLAIFDNLKDKGLAVSSLLSILVVLPFYGVTTIHRLMSCGINGSDVEGKKQVYYDVKNNEHIDWRKLLMLCVKRFIYLINHNSALQSDNPTALIFDDTVLKKTGRKIERVSRVHDHVSGICILGYKLLVCGFWDGESFIPVDFSLHRERGNKHKKYLKAYHKSEKAITKQKTKIASLTKSLQKKQASHLKHTSHYEQNPTNTNKKKLTQSSEKQAETNQKLSQAKTEMNHLKGEKTKAYNALKRYYNKGTLFGLNQKERQAQFNKAVSTKSHGFKRRKESDKSKKDCMLDMLGSAVKKGIIPDYVLVDSWFFCYDLLAKLQRLHKGRIYLIAMVKNSNQKVQLGKNGKEMPVKNILKTYESKARRCRKLKAQYIKVPCIYQGIRLNLFFVRMGRCKTWRLLATTNLSLIFIKLMEIYQIRWSIEVFYKDSKQHLHLSDCQSNTFDAQIADITISMIQYIMLGYFKRINYQQTIGGLFENLARELEEIDLVSRLIAMLWELIEFVCNFLNIDFVELQQDIIREETIMKRIMKLLPEKELKISA